MATCITWLLLDLIITTDSLIVNFVAGFLYYPLLAIGIAVLTIAYRDLAFFEENGPADEDNR